MFNRKWLKVVKVLCYLMIIISLKSYGSLYGENRLFEQDGVNLYAYFLDKHSDMCHLFNGEMLQFSYMEWTIRNGRTLQSSRQLFKTLHGAEHRRTILASQELGRMVQKRIQYIQNPTDCKSAMKLVCDLKFKVGGFGSLLHHVVVCLIAAYATNRTLILEKDGWNYAKEGWEVMFQPLSETCTTYGRTAVRWDKTNVTNTIPVLKMPHFVKLENNTHKYNFFPFAIPDDLADKIAEVHTDPDLWWIGQFVTYLTRPNAELQQWLDVKEDELGFKHPIAGIHVRRTDKINDEALGHTLEEYMDHVIKWYNSVENKAYDVNRTVYIASDDETVLAEAVEKYPNFTFISDIASQFKLDAKRYSKVSLRGIVTDTVFLSRCDYVVCTHSSNICRLVYERMQPMHNDATTLVKSLDYIYHYTERRILKAVNNNKAMEGELNFQVGDQLTAIENFRQTLKDGFVHGINERTRAAGLIPINKTVLFLNRVQMPTYPEVLMD